MAESSAHTEAPAGHSGFPPFQAEHFPSQLVWLTLSFILLYVLMSRIALPRVGAIIADRGRRIADDLKAAQGLKEQSEAANAAYEKALADARTRAQTIASETRDRLQGEADRNRKALEEQLAGRLGDAEKQIAATKGAAMANVRGIATEAAAAIVARLTGVTASEPAVAAAVDAVLKR